jgi:UDP-4-amino-4,6-dideoxy-N-acetyl-beta-L-altrosamine transaminase
MVPVPIPYGRQSIDQADIDAVTEAVSAPLVTQGPLVEQFEKALAAASGTQHAVVASSGTAALHMLYAALGIGPGDEVIVPANTFAATAAAAVLCGARPIIADVDTNSGNLEPPQLVSALSRANNAKLVVAVHFAGRPCDLDGLAAVCSSAGVELVEDACHALGARDQHGNPIGSHPGSRAAVFSFHPVKSITSAEGGAVVTDDAVIADRTRRLRHHGITRADDPSQVHATSAPWHYEIEQLGFNYRLSDIHCALGLSQLNKLGDFVATRDRLARRYDELLAQRCPAVAPLGGAPWAAARSAWHLYVIRVLGDNATERRRQAYEYMHSRGVAVQVHYPPLHHHPFYQELSGTRIEDVPGAEDYYSRCLSLPLFPDLTADQQDTVIDALAEGCCSQDETART